MISCDRASEAFHMTSGTLLFLLKVNRGVLVLSSVSLSALVGKVVLLDTKIRFDCEIGPKEIWTNI